MTRTQAAVAALFLVAPLLSAPAAAQTLELPAPSPKAMVMQRVGVVDVTVTWSSPAKRGRTVWGELVPYGTVWRTGANAATTLETTGDITVGGKAVPAGKYSVFTIPGEKQWTVILNKDPAASADAYDQKMDQVRFDTAPKDGGPRERLTFLFTDTTDDASRLDLVWDGVRVEIPIAVDTKAMVNANLESYVASAASGLARAARHHSENGNVAEGLALIDAALAVEESWYNVWIKAELLHKQGTDHKTAYKLATRAKELGSKAENFFWQQRVDAAIAEWPKR